MNTNVIEQVKDIFQQIDRQTTALRIATGLHCPPDCGRCCENPGVGTTGEEMIPLALELWQRGSAVEWISRSLAVAEKGPCVFSQADRHQEIMPEIVADAKKAIADGLSAPNFSGVGIQLAMLDPLGSQQLPINQALKLAWERVGLIAQYNC